MAATTKSLKIVLKGIMIATIVLWIYNINKKGELEDAQQKAQEVKGRIFRAYRIPDDKGIHIEFTDGRELYPKGLVLNDKVEPGDSLYKPANRWVYIIYIQANPQDSVIVKAE